MLSLKNINHTFDVALGDVGCTIRRGSKWAKVEIGTVVDLMNCPVGHKGNCDKNICKMEGNGFIIGYLMCHYRDIPESLIAMEHNIEARDPEVLERMLKEAYGEVKGDDLYTCLIYKRTSY